ncbi:MAG: type II secretion system F family protein, partial [Deltaproteobacteria bacterium]|nr:type II secretion system F family protein [Deltaproteobacteria bacterium]
MSYFRYKLIEPSGELSSGIAKFPYREVVSAISHLERDGSTTVYVKKLGRVSSFVLELGTLRLRKKLPRPFQAEFFNNLSIMLRSGMNLNTALEEAAGTTGRRDFEADMRDIIMNIQGGASFSEAAERYTYIFPKTVLHLIRLGEETGKLDRTLMDASEHIKRIQSIVSDTKQALLYPSFVFVAMGGGLLFWFYYVVPKIVSLFKEMDVTLPALTVFLLQVSDFVQTNILGIILGIVLCIFFIIFAYKGSRQFRKLTDALLLKLPISSSISSASALAFISEYFSLLINVGIDIMRSMDILQDSVKNEVYRERLSEVKSGLTRGEGIADSFR